MVLDKPYLLVTDRWVIYDCYVHIQDPVYDMAIVSENNSL